MRDYTAHPRRRGEYTARTHIHRGQLPYAFIGRRKLRELLVKRPRNPRGIALHRRHRLQRQGVQCEAGEVGQGNPFGMGTC